MAQEYRALTRLVAACAVVLLLGGCPAPSMRPEAPGNSVAGPQGGSSASPASPSVPPPAPPPRENRLSPATSSLVSQARSLVSRGDLDGASSTLDRALRIEPNNPLLWIELGRLRLVVTREGETDVMTLRAECASPGAGLQNDVAATLRAVTKLGGNVLSSQLDLQNTQSKAGFVSMVASCEIDQPALQPLIYDLEAGMPFLFVEQLAVQAPTASSGEGKLRILLAVSGQWQGMK